MDQLPILQPMSQQVSQLLPQRDACGEIELSLSQQVLQLTAASSLSFSCAWKQKQTKSHPTSLNYSYDT